MSALAENPILVSLAVTILPAIIGYLVYRQSRKVDAIAAQAGLATVESGNIGNVIEGLNSLVTALQNDNKVLREELTAASIKISQILQECRNLKKQLFELDNKLTLPKGEEA